MLSSSIGSEIIPHFTLQKLEGGCIFISSPSGTTEDLFTPLFRVLNCH
jgi:hypothetical protein